MRRARRENSLRRGSGPDIVELAQHVHQHNIENVPRTVLSLWPRAGMQLLGGLLVDAKAPHMRRHR